MQRAADNLIIWDRKPLQVEWLYTGTSSLGKFTAAPPKSAMLRPDWSGIGALSEPPPTSPVDDFWLEVPPIPTFSMAISATLCWFQ